MKIAVNKDDKFNQKWHQMHATSFTNANACTAQRLVYIEGVIGVCL